MSATCINDNGTPGLIIACQMVGHLSAKQVLAVRNEKEEIWVDDASWEEMLNCVVREAHTVPGVGRQAFVRDAARAWHELTLNRTYATIPEWMNGAGLDMEGNGIDRLLVIETRPESATKPPRHFFIYAERPSQTPPPATS